MGAIGLGCPPDADLVRDIADAADADERSVWKYLAGADLRPRVLRRIEKAIAAYRQGLGADVGELPLGGRAGARIGD